MIESPAFEWDDEDAALLAEANMEMLHPDIIDTSLTGTDGSGWSEERMPRALLLRPAYLDWCARNPFVLSDGRRFTTLYCAAHSLAKGNTPGGVMDESTGHEYTRAEAVNSFENRYRSEQ